MEKNYAQDPRPTILPQTIKVIENWYYTIGTLRLYGTQIPVPVCSSIDCQCTPHSNLHQLYYPVAPPDVTACATHL